MISQAPLPYYPPVQQYAAPKAYPAPTGTDAGLSRSGAGESSWIRAVGALASIELLVRQDVTDRSAATFRFFAGLAHQADKQRQH